MESPSEFKPGPRAIGFGVAAVLSGVALTAVGAYCAFGPGDNYFTRHRAGPLAGIGLLALLAGITTLFWCATAKLSVRPEGIVVRGMFGKVTQRIPWGSITRISEFDYDRHMKTLGNYRIGYHVYHSGGRLDLSLYKNADELIRQIGRRSPVLEDLGD